LPGNARRLWSLEKQDLSCVEIGADPDGAHVDAPGPAASVKSMAMLAGAAESKLMLGYQAPAKIVDSQHRFPAARDLSPLLDTWFRLET